MGARRIGHEGHRVRRADAVDSIRFGAVPGGQRHVHAVGKEGALISFLSVGTHPHAADSGLRLQAVLSQTNIGLTLEICRQGIEPIFGPIQFGGRLDALPAPRKKTVMASGVVLQGQAPLPQIRLTLIRRAAARL